MVELSTLSDRVGCWSEVRFGGEARRCCEGGSDAIITLDWSKENKSRGWDLEMFILIDRGSSPIDILVNLSRG